MLEAIGLWIMALGGLVSVIGSLGLIRFPDVYTRSHAQTVVNVGGTCLILLGAAVFGFWSILTIKSLFLVFFIFMTAPVGVHAITRSAYRTGIKPRKLVEDELKLRFGPGERG
jgi:multicomponent Na+:H+ antiporter subunit G